MKKWLLLITAVFLIFIICVYILIPSTINISDVVGAKATRDGTYRTITSKPVWRKWWNYGSSAKHSAKNDTIFDYDGYVYSLIEPGYNSALISIQHANKSFNSKINILQLKTDSIVIMWQCALQTTVNPLEKIQLYYEAKNLKKNLTAVLKHLTSFISEDENIYGIKILETTTKDSFLITTKQMFIQQPTTSDVYNLIDDLKKFAANNNCTETDSPMLNILQDSSKYRVMVALPINKEIQTYTPISFVKMTNGNFMFTRVQGGLATVQNALQQMQLYFNDYDKTSMAITFQYLVTDRIKEADTTKWITEIYAPVL
jgi:hypothetical protein